MDKTPIRTKFVKQLVRVNDQLCFAALGRHEFGRALSELVRASPKEFTTAAFAGNPYAKRLYRQMADMPDFAIKSEQTELQMGVIAGVEYALAYFDEIEAFRALAKPSEADVVRADAPEDQLFAKMSRWLGCEPEKGPYRSLGYLRLLRNHYAHVNDDPSPAFASFVAKHAHHLQRYWDNGITDLGAISFRSLPHDALTAEYAFAIMNLLRVSVEKIDRDFASTLEFDDVLNLVAAEAYESAAHHDRAPERLTSRVRSDLELGYGERFDVTRVRAGVDAFLSHRRSQKAKQRGQT